jgi:hypothetical protein
MCAEVGGIRERTRRDETAQSRWVLTPVRAAVAGQVGRAAAIQPPTSDLTHGPLPAGSRGSRGLSRTFRGLGPTPTVGTRADTACDLRRCGGRYWFRTSDLCRVKAALYR